MGEPVVAIHDGSAGSARAVAAAARISASSEPPVILVPGGRAGEADALAVEARALAGPGARVRAVRPGRPWLRSALLELGPALVALGAASPALADEGLEDLLALGVPVLVVRGEGAP
jgi:hypothetical protein